MAHRTLRLVALLLALVVMLAGLNLVAPPMAAGQGKPGNVYLPLLANGARSEQHCSWSWARGDAPPEVEAEAQQQFAATGIPGTLLVIAHGENNSCDGFHLFGLQYEFAILVDDLEDQERMAEIAARLEELPGQSSSRTNMMAPRIRFETATQFCWWQDGGCGEALNKSA